MSRNVYSSMSLLATLAIVVLIAGCNADPDQDASAVRRTDPGAAERGADSSAAPTSIATALAEPDLFRRAERLAKLLQGPDATPLAEVKRTLKSLRIRESVADFGLLFRYWADREPAEAAAWSLEPGNARFSLAALHIAFEAWGSADPAGALVGVLQANRLSADLQRTAQMALYYGWFSRDRTELEEYVRNLGSGKDRQRAIFAYSLALASADGPRALTDWAESRPDEPKRYKLSVFRQAMNALVWFDLDGALAWCDLQCDGEWGESLRLMVMRNRLRTESSAAPTLEWIARMPSQTPEQDERRKVALRTTYATWDRLDRQASIEWMRMATADADAPDWLPILYPRYVLQISPGAPLEGMVWAERIRDDDRREAALILVARIWLDTDSAAAEAWLEQSSLSAEARERVRETEHNPQNS